MKVKIEKASQVGDYVYAARKSQRVRQDVVAGSVGVSENFLGKVERGSESIQWGKLFQVLDGLGVRLTLEMPPGVSSEQIDRAISQRSK